MFDINLNQWDRNIPFLRKCNPDLRLYEFIMISTNVKF